MEDNAKASYIELFSDELVIAESKLEEFKRLNPMVFNEAYHKLYYNANRLRNNLSIIRSNYRYMYSHEDNVYKVIGITKDGDLIVRYQKDGSGL